MINRILFFAFGLMSLTSLAQSSQPFVVKIDRPAAEVAPTMWGIFFEDINFAADGGLYAELVKNRSFEFYKPLMGWKEEGSERFSMNSQSGYTTIIIRGDGTSSNPRFARVNVLADQGYGLSNEGFRGIGIKQGVDYHFSVMASQHRGGNVSIRIELKDEKGNVIEFQH